MQTEVYEVIYIFLKVADTIPLWVLSRGSSGNWLVGGTPTFGEVVQCWVKNRAEKICLIICIFNAFRFSFLDRLLSSDVLLF